MHACMCVRGRCAGVCACEGGVRVCMCKVMCVCARVVKVLPEHTRRSFGGLPSPVHPALVGGCGDEYYAHIHTLSLALTPIHTHIHSIT